MDTEATVSEFSRIPAILNSDNVETMYFPESSLLIPAHILAYDRWQEILRRTDATGNEHGIVNALYKGTVLVSNIFQGAPTHIVPPLLPHGLRSLLSSVKEYAFIHSHPKVTTLAHVETTVVTDADLNVFWKDANWKILGIIDRGGIHILGKNDPFKVQDQLLPPFVSEIFNTVEERGGTVADIRKHTASQLRPYGIRYYFSPDFNLTVEGQLLVQYQK